MTDLVEKLRTFCYSSNGFVREAADEIERLREWNYRLLEESNDRFDEIERLRDTVNQQDALINDQSVEIDRQRELYREQGAEIDRLHDERPAYSGAWAGRIEDLENSNRVLRDRVYELVRSNSSFVDRAVSVAARLRGIAGDLDGE